MPRLKVPAEAIIEPRTGRLTPVGTHLLQAIIRELPELADAVDDLDAPDLTTPDLNAVGVTDNSGGSADGTLAACGAAVTATDGTTPGAAALKSSVDARLTAIANNFADVAAKLTVANANDAELAGSIAEIQTALAELRDAHNALLATLRQQVLED